MGFVGRFQGSVVSASAVQGVQGVEGCGSSGLHLGASPAWKSTTLEVASENGR